MVGVVGEGGWRAEGEEVDGDGISMEYSIFHNGRDFIEKFYTL